MASWPFSAANTRAVMPALSWRYGGIVLDLELQFVLNTQVADHRSRYDDDLGVTDRDEKTKVISLAFPGY